MDELVTYNKQCIVVNGLTNDNRLFADITTALEFAIEENGKDKNRPFFFIYSVNEDGSTSIIAELHRNFGSPTLYWKK